MLQAVQQRYSWIYRQARFLNEKVSSLLETNTPKNTIAPLDGVRAIACLAVVMFHISFKAHAWDMGWLGHNAIAILLAGDSGVTLFFVLSGFLLFLPYAKSLLFDASWPQMRQFYLRRALRILPGYYCSLFLMIFLWYPQYLRVDHLKQLVLFLTLFMDSSQTTYQQINGPFWTLAVEWQFYLVLPLLALAMRPLVQRGSLARRVAMLTLSLVLLAVWGVFSRYWGLYLTAHPTHTFALPAQVVRIGLFFLYGSGGSGVHGKFLEDFAIGMLAALCFVLARNTAPDTAFQCWMRRLSLWLWGSGLIWLFLMALWEASSSQPHHGPLLTFLLHWYDTFHELGLALGFGACVVGILFGSVGLKSMFSWTPLRRIGLLSYSMYIWHLPLILLFMSAVAPYVQHWQLPVTYSLYWLWFLLAVIPFSFLFFLGVERPWMKLSERIRKQK